MNEEYFIVVNNSHAGPYSVEQLKELNITPETYVWRRGMKQWIKAKDIPELSVVLWNPPAPTPLPVQPVVISQSNEQSSQLSTKEPPSYLVWSIITAIVFFLPLGVVAMIFSGITRTRCRNGEIEKARSSSELAAWFGIGAFVMGLISFPFQIVIALFW
ncbi:MAG: DUF4339 domain-containing protein [Muribaculaceae bacterium]|nr:DUF4339 domain-containing protein [Muribaculaceae bacterium]